MDNTKTGRECYEYDLCNEILIPKLYKKLRLQAETKNYFKNLLKIYGVLCKLGV